MLLSRRADEPLYQQVINRISSGIDSGALSPGDRLPSLRRLSDQLGVSIPTVRQAYIELERLGRVRARPQSGFYVQARNHMPLRRETCGDAAPVEVSRLTLIDQVYEAIHKPDVLPLGIANPSMALPPAKALHRTMKRVMARAERRSLSYAPTEGVLNLRRQIAFRFMDLGVSVDPEEIVITNGAQEALALALQNVCKPGDVVAVESPTYHGMFELIESMGMLVVEIETCPEEGVCLKSLRKALDNHPIKAFMVASSLNNPLGSAMTEAHRKSMVELLIDRDVALIEDDVYGDLLYDGTRPVPARFLAEGGRIMTAGSFSKTSAPGYRIGWLMAGDARHDIRRLKRSVSCSSGLLQQLTLAEFLATGDYDRHLKRLRTALKNNAEKMTDSVLRHFPKGTRVSQPVGGSVLWIEMPDAADSQRVFHDALSEKISVAPGLMFAPTDRYRHFVRLSYGHPWSKLLEDGIGQLGQVVARNRR